MKRILVGISSWQEQTLVKSGFYPAAAKTASERLRYYSTQFHLAELDSSYHFMPTKRNVELWLENTPDQFVFDVKAFSLLTGHPTPPHAIPRALRSRYAALIPRKPHLYSKSLPEVLVGELWTGFAGALEPLKAAGKLGFVIFQFPPWFYPNEESFAHLKFCHEHLSDYRIVVEFRAGKWFERQHENTTLDLLRTHGLGLVCVDEPQGFRSSVPPLAEATAPFSLVRFHGRNAKNWERKGVPSSERFSYLYRETELNEWLPRIRRLAGATEELHIIFKNKHDDFPVRNAQMVQELLSR